MTPLLNQPDLFSAPDSSHYQLDGAELFEYRNVFKPEETVRYLDNLKKEINWQSATICIAGKSIPIPRLQCWVADDGHSYTYSGIRTEPEKWTQTLLTIRRRVEALAGREFNAVLLNYYRNGQDSVSWHADDEPELGPNPVVASVSFGASRPFELKPKQGRDTSRLRLTLYDGSVLIMGNTIQNNYLHQLPKVRNLLDPRINLTFRQVTGVS